MLMLSVNISSGSHSVNNLRLLHSYIQRAEYFEVTRQSFFIDKSSKMEPCYTDCVTTDSESVSSILKDSLKQGELMKVLSDEGRQIFETINFVIISSITGLFGIAANIINIVIFYKQGFGSTVNIGLFALAISDLCCLLSLEWVCVGLNPLFSASNIPWVLVEVMFLSGAWPHVCFCRITSYITSYITAERYLSIAMPLKVKQIITPRRTAVVLCVIYFINFLLLTPDYATAYLAWKFAPSKNRTLLTLTFTSSREKVEGLENVLHSLAGTTSFLAVIIFTSVLVIKLRKTSKWRIKVVSGTRKHEAISLREQKTVKMIVLIASVLIFCYIPGAIISMATFIVGPEFNILGRYINICMATWSIAFVFQTFNSSINIIFYYTMSSKYKQTLLELLFKSRVSNSKPDSSH